MDCPICIEPFNRSHHKIVECYSCSFKACHSCVGTFLLEKDDAGCMNCQKPWDYVFLTSQMTKTFVQKSYKDHVKDVLMREIQSGLSEYQEVASVMNDKEAISKQFNQVWERLCFLEKQERNHVFVNVIANGRQYQLCHDIHRDEVPESRHGVLIIRYVEGLVNPPPTEQDKTLAQMEEQEMVRNIRHYQFLYSCALLNRSVFCTDKILYARSPTMGEVKPELVEGIRIQLEQKQSESHSLYQRYVQDAESTQPDFTQWINDIRVLYQEFWRCYFRLSPPTPQDFEQMQNERVQYTSVVQETRKNLLNAMWEKEDVVDRFYSNKKLFYNLDDCQLYGVNSDEKVSCILEKEEEKWKILVQTHQEELHRLRPLFKELKEKHRELDRKLRLLNKNKTVSGNYIIPCPREECLGKLGDEGICGLCHHVFCPSCMKEKTMNHECQKSDVETIRELRRSTRPCPKCSILIYKSEGCDQMWCVKCHTTFSWKTGAISQGIVHNPHFYQHRQNAARTPGDIPCGGLPNEVEILIAISRSVEDRTAMYDMWDYCDRVAEKLMPRIYQKFHNVRPLKYRRYSIAYMRGKINKKQLQTSLFRNYLDEIRYSHYYGLFETFVDNMAEYMRQFVQGQNTEKECRTLLTLLEQDIHNMNKIFDMRESFRSPV